MYVYLTAVSLPYVLITQFCTKQTSAEMLIQTCIPQGKDHVVQVHACEVIDHSDVVSYNLHCTLHYAVFTYTATHFSIPPINTMY
jgi:hypothetical protein